MKTKVNNVVAVATVIFLFSGLNVFADGKSQMGQKNIFSEEIQVNFQPAGLNAEMLKSTFQKEQGMEKPLEIESWMLNNKNFEISGKEDGLKIDSWMLDPKNWTLSNGDTEEKLEIENWMLDSSKWHLANQE